MIEDLELVALTRPLADKGLQAGDVGTVVMVHEGGHGYTVEFMTLRGATVALVTLPAEAVRPVRDDEISTVRSVQPAARATAVPS